MNSNQSSLVGQEAFGKGSGTFPGSHALQELVMRQEVLPGREVEEATPSGLQIWKIT